MCGCSWIDINHSSNIHSGFRTYATALFCLLSPLVASFPLYKLLLLLSSMTQNLKLEYSAFCSKGANISNLLRTNGQHFCLHPRFPAYLSTLMSFLKETKKKTSDKRKASPRFHGMAVHRRNSPTLFSEPKYFPCCQTEKVFHFFFCYSYFSPFMLLLLLVVSSQCMMSFYQCNQTWWLNFRYGEIFKTNILGCPCVMLASPEAARFVLVTQAHLFKPTYPKSKERLMGPCALFFHQGDYHLRLRKLVQNSMSLESLRKLVPHIETLAVSAMNSWGDGVVFNTFNEMKRVCFLFLFF